MQFTTPTAVRTRRRSSSKAGPDQQLILLIGLLAVATCSATMGLAMFDVFSIWTPREAPKPVPVAVQPPVVVRKSVRTEDTLSILIKQLEDTRTRARELEETQIPIRTQISSLTTQHRELSQVLAQRRGELTEIEAEARRKIVEQQAAEQRMTRLRADATSLDQRIAALRSSIEQVQEANRKAQEALLRSTPQIVECVRGAVILKPQQIRIATSALTNGTLADSIRQRGVHFLVHPDGFDSFLAAQAVAGPLGVTTGYEPVLGASTTP